MKIGAKEMKKAYKDVKLDQIDVCLLFTISDMTQQIYQIYMMVQATPVILTKDHVFFSVCMSRIT